MNAPMIWIGIPLLAAVFLFIMRRRDTLVLALAVAITTLLALLAFFLPIGNPIDLGIFQFQINESFVLLGRRFILDSGDRFFLRLIYAFGAFWFAGGKTAGVHRYFAPLGVAILGLLAAALAVEPFLYAALLIETAVLFSVPILSPPGRPVSQGVLRFLVFQTLAMPFVLIAGWSAGSVEVNPANERLLTQAVALLALGFGFWLAVFPFYSWMPLLINEANPFVAGFVVMLLNSLVFLLSLDFLNAFAWLREFQMLYPALRLVGLIMIVTGGIWAAFQQNLARLLAYAIIVENGFALLALSLDSRTGYEIFISMILARLVAVALWSLSLSVLKNRTTLDVQGLRGYFQRMPLASCGLLMGILGIAGLPLLAVFPMRLYLLENLAQESEGIVLWALIGSVGMLIAGLRLMAALVNSEETEWHIEENRGQAFYLVGGMLILLVIGIFPRWFFPSVQNLLKAFKQLQ